jgi:hypothetical protein
MGDDHAGGARSKSAAVARRERPASRSCQGVRNRKKTKELDFGCIRKERKKMPQSAEKT